MIEFDKYLERLNKENKSAQTIRQYKVAISNFISYFEIETCADINKIDRDAFEAYQGWLLTVKGLSESSVNAYVRPVSAFLKWLKRGNKIKNVITDDVSSIKEPDKLPFFLNDEQIDAMLNACHTEQETLMIAMMLATGLRCVEVTKIKVSDIRDQQVLVHGKGNKERKLFIQDDVYAMLQHYLINHTGEYLFTSMRGNHPISTTAIYLRVKRIANDSGIAMEDLERIHPHTLRHTFCTDLLADTGDIQLCREAMGHSDIATTQRYAHVSSKRMNAVLGGLTSMKGRKAVERFSQMA